MKRNILWRVTCYRSTRWERGVNQPTILTHFLNLAVESAPSSRPTHMNTDIPSSFSPVFTLLSVSAHTRRTGAFKSIKTHKGRKRESNTTIVSMKRCCLECNRGESGCHLGVKRRGQGGETRQKKKWKGAKYQSPNAAMKINAIRKRLRANGGLSSVITDVWLLPFRFLQNRICLVKRPKAFRHMRLDCHLPWLDAKPPAHSHSRVNTHTLTHTIARHPKFMGSEAEAGSVGVGGMSLNEPVRWETTELEGNRLEFIGPVSYIWPDLMVFGLVEA